MVTLKTKEPQEVFGSNKLKYTVYFDLEEIIDKGSHYKALFRYFYIENEKEVDISYKARSKDITVDEANAIASSVADLTENKSKRERDTIEAIAGAKAILQEDKAENWNLNATDWELVNETTE